MLDELKREVGKLVVQATATVNRQDSDRRRPATSGRDHFQTVRGVTMKIMKRAKRNANNCSAFVC